MRTSPRARVTKSRPSHCPVLMTDANIFLVRTGIHDGVFGKQAGFRFEVGIHCAVIVEMILREVGENADVVGDTVGAVLIEGVGRNLHDDRFRALVTQLREQFLQFVGFGRGVIARNRLAIQFRAERANRADRFSRRPQNRGDHAGRRRFAIRAGDTDHLHRVRRVSEERTGEQRERVACVLHP